MIAARHNEDLSMAAYRDPLAAGGFQWRYRRRVRLPGGTTPRIQGTPLSTHNKIAAEQAEAEHLAAALRGEPPPQKEEHKPKTQTLREFYAGRFDSEHLAISDKPGEVKSRRSIFEAHLLPRFGGVPLDAITAEAITGVWGVSAPIRSQAAGQAT